MSDSSTVFLVTNDMFFMPRVKAAAEAAHLTLLKIQSKSDFDNAYRKNGAAFVLIDLESDRETWRSITKSITSSTGTMPKIVAYGPHVEEELLTEARGLGCDTVLPKGAFISKLPRLLANRT